jgi:hypothetical protein
MDSTVLAPRVLVIGLDPYRVPGPWDPKPVADGIEVGRARFIEHGVGAEFCLFGLDGSDDVEEVAAAALCAQPWLVRRHWWRGAQSAGTVRAGGQSGAWGCRAVVCAMRAALGLS